MNVQDFPKLVGAEQLEQAIKAGQDTYSGMQKAAKDTANKFYQAGTDAVAKGYDRITATTREQVEKSFPQALPKFDEAASFAKENLDALFVASAIAQKGTEAIVNEIAAFNQKAFEAGLANLKSFFGMNSYQEIVEKQTAFARGQIDAAVAGAAKVSELAAKVASEWVEPIQVRLTKTTAKLGKPLAA